jgi:YHS domain-containing protein
VRHDRRRRSTPAGRRIDTEEIEAMTLSRRIALLPLMFAIVLLAGLCGSAAGGSQAPVPPINTADGFALKGYDPVAYFTAGEPTPGADQYTYSWMGAKYRFASAENLERFKAAPEKYAPQYGGYCAYAMSLNRIADIDPHRWAIMDGKLYLNNGFVAQSLWSLDKHGSIVAADKHWAVFPKTTAAK